MPFYQVAEHRCPVCHDPLNALGCGLPIERAPDAGDYSICTTCHAVLILDALLTPRRLTDAEWTALIHDADTLPTVLKALEEVKTGAWRIQADAPPFYPETRPGG